MQPKRENINICFNSINFSELQGYLETWSEKFVQPSDILIAEGLEIFGKSKINDIFREKFSEKSKTVALSNCEIFDPNARKFSRRMFRRIGELSASRGCRLYPKIAVKPKMSVPFAVRKDSESLTGVFGRMDRAPWKVVKNS